MKTITFIGNGNMALSIAKGLKNSYKIEVVGRSIENITKFENELGVKIGKSLLDNFNMDDKTIMLCVKPANVEEISTLLKGSARVVYSVLAGTSIKKIKEYISTNAVVRSMPNLAASVGRSMTTLTGNEEFKAEARELLGTIGTTLWLGSEKELDIATALAGSGPAYLALIAEALSDGAVKQGMKRSDAMITMRGLFAGFGELIQDIHPALLKDGVMSPGGTTAAGYAVLEDGNVRAACIKAVEKAYERAKEL
ncbi:MAG: pyrroline-5-carboxylate reductase [Sulfurimonas sp. RIFOXYD12_FULL_33_39]|uniref:pyrroline-5-carboxylate reductase n=1 Tax=unclassified Sulfurimonas TaxID=2623549 RepID=UPI0008BDCCDE|nr:MULTISPECIES: pyrroline-5-carboxylate reductase [unclassified Sulfurimonas]OHE06988.1 MAG: pyrroline-5-carboxylate reductase [Sulfurimonas sp. RIFCSPLOWO2_12_FULL_34_6]OHE08910.1 MAG: pyrroline-5-carboxylate reductase [Sulfurimonas sp. RIFOXYD12_FULL_33_39]OHE14220.1 MAG: pyrroline-5-carboxylate reductase [Sulfurimonas sp. RIFOXYD2_FULL_34_21]DAB27984.1 MAG TPA: pyrroline-5-carboxylate reductase [Sulfurimonas sp. UBA10385]